MASRTFITNSTGTKSIAVSDILAVAMRPESKLDEGTIYRLSVSTSWTSETSFEASTDFDAVTKRLAEIVKVLESEQQ